MFDEESFIGWLVTTRRGNREEFTKRCDDIESHKDFIIKTVMQCLEHESESYINRILTDLVIYNEKFSFNDPAKLSISDIPWGATRGPDIIMMWYSIMREDAKIKRDFREYVATKEFKYSKEKVDKFIQNRNDAKYLIKKSNILKKELHDLFDLCWRPERLDKVNLIIQKISNGSSNTEINELKSELRNQALWSSKWMHELIDNRQRCKLTDDELMHLYQLYRSHSIPW